MNRADQRYCIGRGLAAIRANDRAFVPFLQLALEHAIPQLLKQSAGSTFPNLPQRKLSSFRLASPDVETQRALAGRLQTRREAIQRIHGQIEVIEEAAAILDTVILRRAFSGGL